MCIFEIICYYQVNNTDTIINIFLFFFLIKEQDDMGSVISMIESHSIKIFYVPIGENIRNEVSYYITILHVLL